MSARTLDRIVLDAADQSPGAAAVYDTLGVCSYRELSELSWNAATSIAGAAPSGARIGVRMPASRYAVAAMHGALRAGAIFVPVAPAATAAEVRAIVRAARLDALVCAPDQAARLTVGLSCPVIPARFELAPRGGDRVDLRERADTVSEDDPAYALILPQELGEPRVLARSHRSALSFVDWAADRLDLCALDRLATQSPIASYRAILEQHAVFARGGSVVLIPEEHAASLPSVLDWVSAHSASVLSVSTTALASQEWSGDAFEAARRHLRLALLFGRPCPSADTRRLRRALPRVRLLTLYGHAETGVCAFHELGRVRDARVGATPIGTACCGARLFATRSDGRRALVGQDGELVVAGATVAAGDPGHAPGAESEHTTGDVVRVGKDGTFEYLGRCDAMVSVRGHQIELAAVESALLRSPRIDQAALVVRGSGVRARLRAYIVPTAVASPSPLEVKQICAQKLPPYIVIDRVRAVSELPRTLSGEIDRRRLTALANGASRSNPDACSSEHERRSEA